MSKYLSIEEVKNILALAIERGYDIFYDNFAYEEETWGYDSKTGTLCRTIWDYYNDEMSEEEDTLSEFAYAKRTKKGQIALFYKSAKRTTGKGKNCNKWHKTYYGAKIWFTQRVVL